MPLRPIALRFAPAVVGLATFGLMATLYARHITLYLKILHFVGLDPWDYPFIDGDFIFGMKACWQMGIDVYRTLPCDIVPGNKMAYSPLWQRLPLLPTTHAARNPVGLTTDLLLLLSLTLLPPTRTWREVALMSLATISPMVCFALERNNIDVWIYLLIVAGVWLFMRPRVGRNIAYGAFLLAGLLKYYPFVLFALALKERPARLLAICTICMTVLAVFIVIFWSELLEAVPNIPAGWPSANFEGLVNLPLAFVGLTWPEGTMPGHERTLIILAIRLLLTALVIAWAATLAMRPGFAEAMARLPQADATWLVAGCVVMGGCYALAQNNGYRGIYLLIAISGLLALRRASDAPELRATLASLITMIVPIMWMDALRYWASLILHAAPIGEGMRIELSFVVWLVGELLWLNLERLLIAVMLVFALQTATGGAIVARMRRLAKGSAAGHG